MVIIATSELELRPPSLCRFEPVARSVRAEIIGILFGGVPHKKKSFYPNPILILKALTVNIPKHGRQDFKKPMGSGLPLRCTGYREAAFGDCQKFIIRFPIPKP